jgi:serine/threonine protein kinase
MKGRIQTSQGRSIIGSGLFGVQGREGKKILAKQIQLLRSEQGLNQTLRKYDCFGLDQDPIFMDLLFGMLDFNPLRRISPEEILAHPFLNN